VLGKVAERCRHLRFAALRRFHRDPRLWLPAQVAQPAGRPAGYAAEQDRLRKAYFEAYQGFFRDYLPENGVPARFTVHLLDVPDKAASYEFYGTALYQKALQTQDKARTVMTNESPHEGQVYDMLLKRRACHRPGQWHRRRHMDVAIQDGKIARVAPDIPAAQAANRWSMSRAWW
jgi:hypothetical protein